MNFDRLSDTGQTGVDPGVGVGVGIDSVGQSLHYYILLYFCCHVYSATMKDTHSVTYTENEFRSAI